MIYKGRVTRVGSGVANNFRNELMDALEIDGHPEFRNIRGTTYILDHVRSALGKDAAVLIVNSTVVGVKRDGKTYSETAWINVFNMQGWMMRFLMVGSIMPGIFLLWP